MSYHPTAQGRASIARFHVDLAFRTKEQMIGVINLLLNDEIDWAFEYSTEYVDEPDGVQRQLFLLSVTDGHWGKNLVRLAKMIKKFDYKD